MASSAANHSNYTANPQFMGQNLYDFASFSSNNSNIRPNHPALNQQPGLILGNYWLYVRQLEHDRLNERNISPTTWRKEYERPYHHLFEYLLQAKKPVTDTTIVNLLDVINFLKQFPSHSRTRKRYFVAIKTLWHLANLPTTTFDAHYRIIDLQNYSGNYSTQAVNPRNLPTDAEILDYAHIIKRNQPQWYHSYCYIAIYGLRNTELLALSYDRYPNIFVNKSKTRMQRYVLPFHEVWVDTLGIDSTVRLPSINRNSHLSFSHAVTTVFRKANIPFRPKDLRHCYARRMAELNYPTLYAAKLMGHSIKVHESSYLNFVDLDSYLNARP